MNNLSAGKNMKILIVDDSKPMRRLVERTMLRAGFSEHEYSDACDGLDAMEKIAASQPDLILADWNMPNMNGLELLQAIRKDFPEIKLGFVTSEQTDEMINLAMTNGALFTIGKPFTVEVFQEKLALVMGKES
jgi:two-component system chemotaxis response regulator CheY